MHTQRFPTLVLAGLLSFGCGGSDATEPRTALLDTSASSTANAQSAELATKQKVLVAHSYQVDVTAADIVEREGFGRVIEVVHGLNQKWPMVVIYHHDGMVFPGPYLWVVAVDENTVRIGLNQLGGTFDDIM